MNIKLFSSILTKIILFVLIALLINQCGIYRKTDAREIPTNAKDRVKKNIEEGRKIKFGQLGSRGSGKFEFATSNEMWRATVEILDFMPLANVDYGGGVIITDWYNESNDNESIKIAVRFLSNDIRADSLKIIVHKKKCSVNQNCGTSLIKKSKISDELRIAILKKAALLEKDSKSKKKK